MPQCDGKNFVREQQQNKTIIVNNEVKVVEEAFCVNRWGKEYKDSRVDGVMVNCDKYEGMYSIEHCQ